MILKKVFNAKIYFFGLRIFILILGQISSILIVRISTVETYSEYVLINSFVMALCLLNQNGLSRLILRELPKLDFRKNKAISFIRFCLFQSAVSSVALIAIVLYFKDDIFRFLIKNSTNEHINTSYLFFSIFLWFSCLGLLNILTESFRGIEKLGISMALGGIEGVGGYGKGWMMNVSFIALSVFYFTTNKKISIVELTSYSSLINLFIMLIGMAFLVKEGLKVKQEIIQNRLKALRLEFIKIKHYLAKYSNVMLYLLFSEILLLLNSQSDLWLLNQFSSQINVGYYSVSQRTIGIIIAPIASICSLFIADISKSIISEKRKSDFAAINRKISILSVPSIAALVLILFFSRQVLVLIYGINYQDASLIFWILSLRGLIVVAFPALLASLLMAATQREIFMISLLSTVASFAFEYVLLKLYDAPGLAFGSVFGYGVENIIAYYLLRYKYSINAVFSFKK